MRGKGATKPQIDRKTPPAVPDYSLEEGLRQIPQAAEANTGLKSDHRDQCNQCAEPVTPDLARNSDSLAPNSGSFGAKDSLQHQALLERPFALFPRDGDSPGVSWRPLIGFDSVARLNQEISGRRGDSRERPRQDARKSSRYPERDLVKEPAVTRQKSQPDTASGRIGDTAPSNQPSARVGPSGNEQPPRNESQTALSRLAGEYVHIPYGDFAACERFMEGHPDIRQEDPNRIVQEGIRLQKEGKGSLARICTQQSLLLRICSKLSRKEMQTFFEQMKAKDRKTMGTYGVEFDKTWTAIQNAAQVGVNPNQVRGATTASADIRSAVPHSTRDPGQDGCGSVGSIPHLEIRNMINDNGLGRQQPAQAANQSPLNLGRLPALPSADENTRARSPSIAPDFRGENDGSTIFASDLLDHRYQRRPDAARFFVIGRVFALLWHESVEEHRPSNGSSVAPHTTMGRYGQIVFSHIRRMAVVQQRQGYCVCIPVATYGGQGVSRPGLNAPERKRHAIIYASDMQPYEDESENGMMTKKPIAVDTVNAEQKLDRMSRINFGMPTSVEWNVKVMHVGRIAQNSMANFTGYWQNENMS